ncbi:hypothetical protein OS493_024787 [Desmophyllum pertusum]|uniref:Uncharacterized protein n=1 Tax=Desmophyllum pertusum TaxID=174260 RepID=A0A9W9ZAK3_9CNID|nr:hypothetical protein OS493_024787 [Desmophyllum pertusum]
MASAPKSSRSRKLPSPRNRDLPTTSGGNYSKPSKETQNGMRDSHGALDVVDPDEPPTRDVTSPSKSGVAYLTENLIKRLTKVENIAQITTLHVTLGKDLNKKIKYIENLENLRKLLHLTLNNHMIEKIEKLDHLTQLRELHLANNCIPKIEGVDCLVHLTVLNLNGNLIETLPAPVFKKLKELQAFHIAHNRLGSHIEVTKLRPLQDLNNFSMDGNPMASLEHSQLFVIFQLRSLNCLDGKQISEEERQMADKRFAQEEVRRLESEINRAKKEYEILLEENCQALEELQQLRRLNSEQQAQSLDQSQKIKELHRHLEAKEELLASKTAELSKACEKQFKLEQELAFYKLDAKFEHLGMLPLPDGVEFGDGEEDESPYIGKARFKPNKFSRKSNIVGGEQHAQMTTLGSRPSDKYDEQNKQAQQEIHDALILDLQDKERAIQQAENVLAQLTDQLTRRKAQLQDAGDKLALIQQAIDDQAHLLGEEERKLLEAIADKKNYIRKLQEVAKELEERMKNILDDLRQREAETEKLRQTIRNTPPDDPAYSHLQARLSAKEQQLLELRDEYGKLKQDHERARERLQEEIAAVKELEAKLAALKEQMATRIN